MDVNSSISPLPLIHQSAVPIVIFLLNNLCCKVSLHRASSLFLTIPQCPSYRQFSISVRIC